MQKIIEALKKVGAFIAKHTLLFCFVTAALVNLVVEMLSRQSVIRGIAHLFTSPEVFFYNTLIIFAVALLCLFFRRRAFALVALTFPFLALGVINCAVLAYRVTPISATDFLKIKSIFGIFNLYLEGWVLLVIILAVIAIIAGFVFLFKISTKRERLVTRALAAIPIVIVAVAITANVFISKGYLSKKFTNLNDAYDDWGFVYCFSSSVFDTGISKPRDYSTEKVETILDKIKAKETQKPEVTPNVIFLQLESFFNPMRISSLKISENPIPFFTSLMNDFGSAYVEVPYIGSGTANVEFEVLTGMSLDFFGPGEYPYKTILQRNACESLAFNLKELSYTAHAIHNHKGSFYDRAHVFSSLGFDTFTSLEFMKNVEYNPIGWACDGVLTEEIVKALDSTEGDDFVYAISVQSHGVYPNERLEGVEYPFEVEVLDDKTLVDPTAFEYYLTQLREVDNFIKELITTLSTRKEETVVVLFGDHLPYFDLTDEEMTNSSVYQTEYVIWSNYALQAEAKNVYSYELAAHVLGELNINSGLITKLHQNSERNEEYFKSLETLQYDMLYGNRESRDYEPSELQMGIHPLTVKDISQTELGVEVSGDNFTDFTRVSINGKKHEVVKIDDDTLLVPEVELVFGDTVSVVQTNGKRTTFSESEIVIIGEDFQAEPWE